MLLVYRSLCHIKPQNIRCALRYRNKVQQGTKEKMMLWLGNPLRLIH